MPNILKSFWPRKWPSKKQWKKFPEVLSKNEKIVFFSLVFLLIASFSYTVASFYYSRTEVIPAQGGVYREGFIHSTRMLMINPLYASQSEVERDIIEVVFDGLMRHNKRGEIVPNLAESYSTEDNKNFKVTLKEDLYWSDGEKMTADDIVFTVRTIQSPDFQSTLRQKWIGVQTEKISEREVVFSLEEPSVIFPENLDLKIIPQHVFEDYSPRDFRYSVHNIRPVGSGPYRFKEMKEDARGDIEHYKLERNPHYFRSEPYLDKISFHFFRDVDELLRAQRRREIDGFALAGGVRREISLDDIRGFEHYKAILPRYFSSFFNLQSEGTIKELSVREALNYATDKNELIEKVLDGKGHAVNSPLLYDFYMLEKPDKEHVYDLDKAREILKEAGFEEGKKKTEDPFSFEEDLKEESQGEEVRNLQRCFLYLQEEDEEIYPEGEVTGFFDENTKESVVYFQEKYSAEILDPGGFKSGTGMVSENTRDKLNELCEDLFDETLALEISITTLDEPLLMETAKTLTKQWERLGIETSINKKSSIELKEDVIRKRNFEILLFGTMLSGTANPLPLWHSTKIDDPGLNFSGYENEEVDKLLEKVTATIEKREENLSDIQNMILDDVPAVFLYNPYFFYSVSREIKGIEERILVDSSKRFEDIDRWYINTKRVIKNSN